MPRKKEQDSKEETVETATGADSEVESETPTESEELTPDAAKEARKGISGAVKAIFFILVIVVLLIVAYTVRENARKRAEEVRAARRQVLATQLAAVRDNIQDAVGRIDADPPDIEGAIKTLNDARDQVGDLALLPQTAEVGLSAQLVDLQGEIKATTDALRTRSAQYEEAVRAARRELKTGALDDVRPLAGKLDAYISHTHGDVDTPLLIPGVSAVPSRESSSTEEPKPAEERQSKSD